MDSGPDHCAVCGGALEAWLSGAIDPDSGEAFSIGRCSDCGIGQTAPRPRSVERYYQESYFGNRHSFTERYCMARRMRLLERAMTRMEPRGGSGGRRLLDIGCGNGSFLRLACKAGWRCVGTELGKNLAAAQNGGIDVVESLDTASRLGPFDAVTSWHSLEHVDNPGATLSAVRGMTAQGAKLIVAVPDAAGLQASLFREHWFHLDVPRHLFHFDRASLTALVSRSGFRVVATHHLEVELDLFGWMQSALNSVSSPPNVLFRALTGKPTRVGRGVALVHVGIGAALAPFALSATAASAVLRRGATIVTVAEAA